MKSIFGSFSQTAVSLAALLSLALAFSSCSKALIPASGTIDPVHEPVSWKGAYTDVESLTSAVRTSAVAIEPDYGVSATDAALPPGLVDAIAGHSIALFGERHYMLEHHRTALALAHELHGRGFRALAFEMDQAESYAIDDYVTGERDDLPTWAGYIERELIAGFRAFNLTLPKSDRMHLVNFDMNHDPSLYSWALYDHAAFQTDSRISTLVGTYYNYSSVAYRDAVSAIGDSLAANEQAYRASWGDLWYDRAVRLTKVELASWEARHTDSDLAREDIIVDNVETYIAGWEKIIVMCGSAHAQKTAAYTNGDNGGAWLGVRLAAKYGDALWSGLFLPVSGSLPNEGNDSTCYKFDELQNADDNDLVKIVSDSYPGMLVYLPFVIEPFLTNAIGLYSDVYVPAKTYNALILYPQVSSISFATGHK